MKEIPLTRGYVALVDDEDFEWLSQWKWRYSGVYVVRSEGVEKTPVYMHRVIMEAPIGMEVDHIDGNRINNQRANLRVCTKAQNLLNQKRRSGGASQYKGVLLAKPRGWRAQIRIPLGKLQHIGVFATEIEAAHAYDEAARKYHGEFARLNFPD